jgi:hypothetical protein
MVPEFEGFQDTNKPIYDKKCILQNKCIQPIFIGNFHSLHKPLQWISATLQLMKVFFPGILILFVAAFLLNNTIQGRDLIISGLESKGGGWILVTALLFWTLITWYTSRLISYNNHNQHRLPAWGRLHIPRWLGFNCPTIIFSAICQTSLPQGWASNTLVLLLGFTILYLLYNLLFERYHTRVSINNSILLKSAAWMLALVWSIGMAIDNNPLHWLLLIPPLQMAILHLVTTRRMETENGSTGKTAPNQVVRQNDALSKLMEWLFNQKATTDATTASNDILQEKSFFTIFSVLSLLALVLYLAALWSPAWARILAPLPILIMGFGILLGAGNILSMLSFKLNINFHFLAIAAIVCAGFFHETHGVKLMPLEKNLALHSERPKLRPHFNRWMATRAKALEASKIDFPIYLVLSDGGASRSAYWTASVLSRLDSLNHGQLLPRIFSLSGSSGGSLGNLSFLAAQTIPTAARTKTVQSYLSSDFLSYPLVHLMGTDIILPLLPGNRWGDRSAALEKSLQQTGTLEIDSFMLAGFSSLNPSYDTMMKTPVVFVNCTRMQDGRPAAISNIQLDEKTFGHRLDVLRELGSGKDLSMAAATVLGARFPYFSPAGRIHNNYYVDAGYLDNSGAGITHEMLIDLHAMIADSTRKNPLHPFAKIRFHILHITNDPASKSAPSAIHPLLNDLAAPLLTLTNAHARQTDFNNLRLKKYLQEINGNEESYQVINLYENGLADELPMNWKLSPKALESINKRLREIK